MSLELQKIENFLKILISAESDWKRLESVLRYSRTYFEHFRETLRALQVFPAETRLTVYRRRPVFQLVRVFEIENFQKCHVRLRWFEFLEIFPKPLSIQLCSREISWV